MKQPGKYPEVGGLTALALVGQLGLVVALCIVGGLVAGLVVDRWLGGTGIFLVAGILIGIGAGIFVAYRMLMREAQNIQ